MSVLDTLTMVHALDFQTGASFWQAVSVVKGSSVTSPFPRIGILGKDPWEGSHRATPFLFWGGLLPQLREGIRCDGENCKLQSKPMHAYLEVGPIQLNGTCFHISVVRIAALKL